MPKKSKMTDAQKYEIAKGCMNGLYFILLDKHMRLQDEKLKFDSAAPHPVGSDNLTDMIAYHRFLEKSAKKSGDLVSLVQSIFDKIIENKGEYKDLIEDKYFSISLDQLFQ